MPFPRAGAATGGLMGIYGLVFWHRTTFPIPVAQHRQEIDQESPRRYCLAGAADERGIWLGLIDWLPDETLGED